MKNFVISVSNAFQRRAHIENEFSAKAVEFEFFDAVVPATVEATARALGLDPGKTDLHQLEVACLLSHVALWKKATDDQLDYICIFEDDIHLGEQAHTFLMDSSWIPMQCGLIKMEVRYKKILTMIDPPAIKLQNKRKLLVLGAAHMGCGGYILSREVACELLDFTIRCQQLNSVDHIVFKNYPKDTGQKVYQMAPALCIQDIVLTGDHTRFPSYLENVRNMRKGENWPKKRLSNAGKLQREVARSFAQMTHTFQEQMQLFQGKRVVRMKFR